MLPALREHVQSSSEEALLLSDRERQARGGKHPVWAHMAVSGGARTGTVVWFPIPCS